MNKKIFAMTLTLLVMVILTTPVLAVPTQGQKIPVSLKFTPIPGSTIAGEYWITNGSIGQRRDAAIVYTIELSIDGMDPVVGVSNTERPIIVYNIIKHQSFTIHEIHVMSFSAENGGFEGNALLKFTEFVSLSNYQIKTQGTFHGTGAFEGQTIVASYEGPQGGIWTGYILKP